ncbi:MAG: IS4 family transposase [Prolixibacteraceae bacterium]|nr:IS4 family transposase [Prolixibacteraceae bacterium]
MREVFSEKELQKKAVASGFYKRSCEFTPTKFFDLLLYCASHSQLCSLSQASSSALAVCGLKIAKQSIDGRFTGEAVVFVLDVLKEVLERQLSRVFCADFLPQFNQVCIKDSTKFNVDNRLREHFKGTGGRLVTKACVCIQYEYDLRSGKILDLNVTEGVRNDAIDAAETKGKINKDDLILRDLGYYNLSVLTGFANEGAFFISRLNVSTLIYDLGQTDSLEFKELYAHMSKHKLTSCEKQVLVGKVDQVELRLIVDIVPEKVYEERIRKINEYNKFKGWKTSDDYKARCRFNLFITNVSAENISLEEVMLLYRLRWQVELMFKSWKSVCAIHKLQPMKYERFACLLFAKLILIIVNLQIIRNLQGYHFKKTRQILSEYKCFKTLQDSFSNLKSIWKERRKKSEKNLMKLIGLFSSNHWKENRKERNNLSEIINLFVYKSNYYGYI